MEISMRLLGQQGRPDLKPRGKQISQDEFMKRWGSCSWPNHDVNHLTPESSYFAAAGELSRYSGVRDWYRPALWWEWLIVLTWGRVFWFHGKRWSVWVENYRHAETLKECRTRLGAFLFAVVWMVRQHPAGTLELPGREVWLYDRMIGTVHRNWIYGAGK